MDDYTEFRKRGLERIAKLLYIFSIIGLLLALFTPISPPSLVWAILAACAVTWFAFESEGKKTARALRVGLFLMLFDFAFENAGWLAGLWHTSYSAFAIGAVPVEIMMVTLFGGAAWAMYSPKKYNRIYAAADVLLFSAFGAVGEYLLSLNGLITYTGGWTGAHAFASYAATWAMLEFVNYNVLKNRFLTSCPG